MNVIFHLAIPSHDLDISKSFYKGLGIEIGREGKDNFIMNFFGDQLVCHLSPAEYIENPKMYPRHFGVVFKNELDFYNLYKRVKTSCSDKIFQELFTRFKDSHSEHDSFFLKDPSGNLLEFKFYKNEAAIFN